MPPEMVKRSLTKLDVRDGLENTDTVLNNPWPNLRELKVGVDLERGPPNLQNNTNADRPGLLQTEESIAVLPRSRFPRLTLLWADEVQAPRFLPTLQEIGIVSHPLNNTQLQSLASCRQLHTLSCVGNIDSSVLHPSVLPHLRKLEWDCWTREQSATLWQVVNSFRNQLEVKVSTVDTDSLLPYSGLKLHTLRVDASTLVHQPFWKHLIIANLVCNVTEACLPRLSVLRGLSSAIITFESGIPFGCELDFAEVGAMEYLSLTIRGQVQHLVTYRPRNGLWTVLCDSTSITFSCASSPFESTRWSVHR